MTKRPMPIEYRVEVACEDIRSAVAELTDNEFVSGQVEMAIATIKEEVERARKMHERKKQ